MESRSDSRRALLSCGLSAVPIDPLVEITLTTIAACGSFLLAEHFGASGIISALVAGLLIGSGGTRFLSRAGRARVHSAWEYFAYLANSFVFILIGMSVANQPIHRLSSPAAAVAILLVLAGRALAVYPPAAAFGHSRRRLPAPNQHSLFWGRLRGALACAGARRPRHPGRARRGHRHGFRCRRFLDPGAGADHAVADQAARARPQAAGCRHSISPLARGRELPS